VIHHVYSAVARRRRRFYAAHPERQRRLSRPVISVGNLAVGGRGKTPAVAAIAARLLAMGERPAILSRGYARRRPEPGVVVVRDPSAMRADLDRAGDEALMLARALDGAAVLVCEDRYLAGRVAEHHFGCTVHLLDDGFQHLRLYRDIDLVMIAREDLEDPRTLPSGRLREPLEAMRDADAIVALEDADVNGVATGRPVWRARRRLLAARLVEEGGEAVTPAAGAVVALAGTASPGRFFADLRAAGWPIARTIAFRDHHRYNRRDLERIAREARAAGAALVVTTEKDVVRLLPLRPLPMAVAWVPLAMTIEPEAAFGTWLAEAIAAARGARHG
jgi:tetraacyldisaccharide 4'-kinase